MQMLGETKHNPISKLKNAREGVDYLQILRCG